MLNIIFRVRSITNTKSSISIWAGFIYPKFALQPLCSVFAVFKATSTHQAITFLVIWVIVKIPVFFNYKFYFFIFLVGRNKSFFTITLPLANYYYCLPFFFLFCTSSFLFPKAYFFSFRAFRFGEAVIILVVSFYLLLFFLIFFHDFVFI